MIRQGKTILAIVFLGITLGGIRGSLAQTVDAAKAAMVKSAYLLNFAKFTTWPDGTFSDKDSPFVICVWDSHSLEQSLEQVIEGKTLNGRAVVISRIAGHTTNTTTTAKNVDSHKGDILSEDVLAKLNQCHLLYIGKSESNHVDDLLKAVAHLKVLTISDIPHFAEQGGMIGLVLRKGKIVFDANLITIKQTGIKVSSKILRLANIVHTNGK